MGFWRTIVLAAGLLAASETTADAGCSVGKLLELPVTMSGLRPMVPAKINGHEALFIADSGAFYSLISPGAAAEFGLRATDLPYLKIGGVGGETDARAATVKDFNLAGVPLRNIEFLVGGSDVGSAGLLGQNVLGIADVEYDLSHAAIRLMRSHDCENANLAYWSSADKASFLRIEPVTPSDPHTVGLVSVNGVAVHAVFDTGAPTSILSRRAAARAGIRTDGADVVPAGYQGGLGRRMTMTWIAPVQDFKVGDEEIRRTHLRIGDLGDADMLIGADFFLSHRVYVATGIRRMFFTYNGGPVFNLTVDKTARPLDDTTANAGVDPADAEGFSRRGEAFASRRDYARALADLDRAVALAPRESRYLVERAVAHADDGHPDLARADFNRAIALKPDNVDARMARAGFRLDDRDKAGARADLQAASDAMPKQADLRLVLAGMETQAGALDRSIADYDAWIALHGADNRLASALNGRCWSRALAGRDLPKAAADCSRSLSTWKRSPMVLDSRGLVYLRMGDNARAIADYNAALAGEPKLAGSLYGRGLAERRIGKTKEGDADIAAARNIDAKAVDALKDYGIDE